MNLFLGASDFVTMKGKLRLLSRSANLVNGAVSQTVAPFFILNKTNYLFIFAFVLFSSLIDRIWTRWVWASNSKPTLILIKRILLYTPKIICLTPPYFRYTENIPLIFVGHIKNLICIFFNIFKKSSAWQIWSIFSKNLVVLIFNRWDFSTILYGCDCNITLCGS